jgi:hypothetical protein
MNALVENAEVGELLKQGGLRVEVQYRGGIYIPG